MSLQYGSRSTYINGLGDVVDAPVLTLAMEFDRDMEWTDWQGRSYTLRQEWAYVNGGAQDTPGCTAGRRDADRNGWTPDPFLSKLDAFVRSWRQAARQEGREHKLLPEDNAFLTRDEVLSVRLYSGPAYQPINHFLRSIGLLSSTPRRAMARDRSQTFTATVGLLVSATRKLAAVVTPEEVSRPLYRSVRGELPRGFWVRDDLGMVCATDTAFMSTSRSRETPINYMGENGANVLWELKPAEESDAAYHTGADISMLSQFGAEQEVLFPPCCMLTLREPPGAPSEEMLRPSQSIEEGGKTFVPISVMPSFV